MKILRIKYFIILIVLVCTIGLAACKTNDCIVTFDYNLDGLGDYTQNFEVGSTIVFPEEIELNDYDFLGWYLNNELISNDYIVSKNIVLFGKWSEVKVALAPQIPSTRDEITTYKDITYKIVDDEELKMDIYMPPLKEGETCPVIFFYFGGGFVAGSKELLIFIDDIPEQVLNAGIAVIAVNYRLSNNHIKYPDPVSDAIDAIRYTVKYSDVLGIDVNNMGSIGFSAGGYMALMAGFAQDYYFGDKSLKNYTFKLKFVVDMYGPSYYSAEEIGKLSTIGLFMLTSFLGQISLNNPELKKTMPSYYIKNNNPNVYIVHGLADSLVPTSQSINFYNLLQENNIESSLLLVKGAEHTLSPASGYETTIPTITEVYNDIARFIISQCE